MQADRPSVMRIDHGQSPVDVHALVRKSHAHLLDARLSEPPAEQDWYANGLPDTGEITTAAWVSSLAAQWHERWVKAGSWSSVGRFAFGVQQLAPHSRASIPHCLSQLTAMSRLPRNNRGEKQVVTGDQICARDNLLAAICHAGDRAQIRTSLTLLNHESLLQPRDYDLNCWWIAKHLTESGRGDDVRQDLRSFLGDRVSLAKGHLVESAVAFFLGDDHPTCVAWARGVATGTLRIHESKRAYFGAKDMRERSFLDWAERQQPATMANDETLMATLTSFAITGHLPGVDGHPQHQERACALLGMVARDV
jgi:hypothetical protein